MSNINASGYKDVNVASVDKMVAMANTLIDRNWESDWLDRVVNSSVLAPLTETAQVVQFNKPARVGGWRPYEKHEALISDQPSSDSICIQICNTAYKSIVVDNEDIRRSGDDWTWFEAGFLDDAWRELSTAWRQDALAGMQVQVSSLNQGDRAGMYRNINLGTVGNAVLLTSEKTSGTKVNLIAFLNTLRSVLDDAGRWYDGQMFIILPASITPMLSQIPLSYDLCCELKSGSVSEGYVANRLAGFEVIISRTMRPVVDPTTNRLVYTVLAGWNDAYAFTGKIVSARVLEDTRTFATNYQMLSAYGGGAIYPDGLAKAYVSFDTDNLVK